MSSDGRRHTRRELLRAGGIGSILLTAGCTEFLPESRNQLEAASLSDAEFDFEYNAQAEQVTTEYTGGGQIPAGDLTVQSSAGFEVVWPQIGSTTTSPDEYLETGDLAVLGPETLNWERAVTPSETIRIVYRIDEAPTTLAQFTPESNRTDSPDKANFEDGFEDGNRDGWSVIQSPSASDWSGNNMWSVTSNAIAGEHSLFVESTGDASANIIATDDRIIDLSRDFTFSYEWYTNDPSNRGPHIQIFDADGTDFQDEGLNPYRPEDGIGVHYGGDAIDPDGSPYTDKPIRFGTSELPHVALEADTEHVTRIEKRGDKATLFIDGEELGATAVTDGGRYRLALMTAGTFGDPSSMTWDTIRVSYG